MDVRHYAQELGVSFLSIQAQDFIEEYVRYANRCGQQNS